jgi:hypothetical protein
MQNARRAAEFCRGFKFTTSCSTVSGKDAERMFSTVGESWGTATSFQKKNPVNRIDWAPLLRLVGLS